MAFISSTVILFAPSAPFPCPNIALILFNSSIPFIYPFCPFNVYFVLLLSVYVPAPINSSDISLIFPFDTPNILHPYPALLYVDTLNSCSLLAPVLSAVDVYVKSLASALFH